MAKKSERKKKSRSKYDDDTQKKVIKDVKEGATQMSLSKKYKVPRSTVWSWCKKAGLVTPMKKKKSRNVENEKKQN